MYATLHDLLDDIAIAFDTEGISEKDMRDAILDSLAELARTRLGSQNELVYIIDKNVIDHEIQRDLDAFNSWETPNTKETENEHTI